MAMHDTDKKDGSVTKRERSPDITQSRVSIPARVYRPGIKCTVLPAAGPIKFTLASKTPVRDPPR